jgi:hypothetical protein
MSDKITMELLQNAKNKLKEINTCKNCGTQNDEYFVAGYMGLFCKCQAEELSKTNTAKEMQSEINKILFPASPLRSPDSAPRLRRAFSMDVVVGGKN